MLGNASGDSSKLQFQLLRCGCLTAVEEYRLGRVHSSLKIFGSEAREPIERSEFPPDAMLELLLNIFERARGVREPFYLLLYEFLLLLLHVDGQLLWRVWTSALILHLHRRVLLERQQEVAKVL